MNKLMLLILLIFSFVCSGRAQEKVVIRGDTLVTITPKQLGTINGIIVDFEYTKKELALKDSLLSLNQKSIMAKDSIIGLQKENLILQEQFYQNLNKQIKKDNKKYIWISSGVGALVGLLIGIFIR